METQEAKNSQDNFKEEKQGEKPGFPRQQNGGAEIPKSG